MRLGMLIVAVIACGSMVGSAQTTKPSLDEGYGNAALAEQLAQMAQGSLAGKAIVPATLRESAALLEAACRLNPDEPRFFRLLTEACLQLGGSEGRDGAIASLSSYRRIAPDDQVAQIRLIDLYYSRMETADAKMKYLGDLLGSEALTPEVRSHVAVLASQLALDRAASDQAREYLEQALKLFPLSPEALRMQYQQLGPDTSPAQRVASLLTMLRSNPVQPAAMTELAGQLAAVGLVDPAMSWYTTSFSLAGRMGMPPNFPQYTAYAAEMVIAGQLQSAQGLVQKLIEQDPSSAEAAFLSLLIEKRSGNEEKIQKATDQVRAALLTRLSRISDQLNHREPATTQPSSAIDIPADLKLLTQANDANLTAAYASGLADLAWLEIYFNGKTAEAQPHLAALRQLLAPESPTLARLEGWSYLVDSKPAEARVKLSAVADRDPLAQLGLLRLEAANAPADAALAAANKLLYSNPSGLIGAMLMEALRDRVGLMPPAPAAAQVRTELDKFPKDWLDFLDSQKVKALYALKAEPLKVAHVYGEPILARVTIANTSNFDITLGPDGAIRPDLWIDASIKGLTQQYLPGVAFERLGQKLLLKPRESLSQIVRVDQGNLAALLNSNPTVGVPLYFSALTNPITQQAGIAPGPGGYRVQFVRVVERSPAPLSDPTIQGLYTQLLAGTADAKVRTLQLLGAYAGALRSHGEEQTKSKATELIEVIRKATGDRISAVAAEAMFVTVLLAEPATREGIIRQMLASDSFPQRVMGLAALQTLEPAKRKEIAKPLAQGDADEVVKKLAAAMIEVADLPPPTTAPTTQEGAGPTTREGQ